MLSKNLLKLGLLAFALNSISVYANQYASNIDNRLMLANTSPSFEFNIGAAWLKPGASNLNYVIFNRAGAPIQTPIWKEQELSPNFTSAFSADLQYNFPTIQPADIQLNWTHLRSSTSDSIAAPNSSYFLGPDYEIGPSAIPIHNASGKVNFRYDVVNLDVGQFLNLGGCFKMRFFEGLSAGLLRENVTATYTGNTTGLFAGPFSMQQKVTSDFTGVGPRFGIHADYKAYAGFGLVGEAAISALIGTINSKTSYLGSSQELLTIFGQTTNSQSIKDERVYQVIPGFDTKLGINYQYPFNNNTLFTVAAGYQAAVYINAISQYLPSSLVLGEGLETGGIFVATMSHTLSNYSVQGPFLNFALQF